MSLRTIQRLTMMSVLVLGSVAATGCGDDEGGGDEDAGGNNNGGTNNGGTNNNGTNNGGEDAGTEDAGTALMCGDETEECEGGKLLGLLDIDPCCAEGEGGDEVCGINLSAVPSVGEAFPGCTPQNAPYGSDDHPICDALVGGINGTTGVDAGGFFLKLGGCCTPEGFCGIDSNAIGVLDEAGAQTDELSLKAGCVGLGKFSATVPAGAIPPGTDLDKIPCGMSPDGG